MTEAITHDPATWPNLDNDATQWGNPRIWAIARAIAMAEGANIEGSNPDRLNNPGDISDGFDEFGGEPHSGSKVTHFPDKETGWKWLYDKLDRAAKGESHVFRPYMSWYKFAKSYAGNWSPWVHNVCTELGVDPNSTFGAYANGGND